MGGSRHSAHITFNQLATRSLRRGVIPELALALLDGELPVPLDLADALLREQPGAREVGGAAVEAGAKDVDLETAALGGRQGGQVAVETEALRGAEAVVTRLEVHRP